MYIAIIVPHCLQIVSYKSDFEAERRDREAAHSKLADLEKALEKEKGHIGYERAAYEKRFDEFQQGSAKNAASYAVLKKQKEKLEKEVKASLASSEKLQEDLTKSTRESARLQEEMKAKVSQVRQYKKENDRLKAQVIHFCDLEGIFH